jgi:ubiquinone/menaquinone biosynthesis C-methylase UbiE
MVKQLAVRKRLDNVQTIHSDCQSGLQDQSIDVVLLYDVLHDLKEPDKVLTELGRILISGGLLSVSDHHLKKEEIVLAIIRSGIFNLVKQGKKTFTFQKNR